MADTPPGLLEMSSAAATALLQMRSEVDPASRAEVLDLVASALAIRLAVFALQKDARVELTRAQLGAGSFRGGGERFAADDGARVTEAAAPSWLATTGLPLDERGFLAIDDTLRSTGDDRVFAAGDAATMLDHRRPKAGVFAVRQGPALAANLRAAMTGQEIKPFATGARYLALISAGRRTAVGFWNGFSWQGEWAWKWKDRIDRKFMQR